MERERERERERGSVRRERKVYSRRPFFLPFFTRSENNNFLKKLLSLLSHHNVSERLHNELFSIIFSSLRNNNNNNNTTMMMMMMTTRSNNSYCCCSSSCSSSSSSSSSLGGGKGGRGDVSVSFSSFSRRRRKKSSHFRRRALSSNLSSSSEVNEVEVEVNERAKHYFTKDSFYAHADKLYSSFQNNHSNAKKANAERFCWDYWHVENQYTQLRTPAKEYYYEGEILNEFYAKFEEELLKYARENLALSNFTPIWMSCYVDGMGQELHADVPHGPLAFVFSLTKNFDDSDDDKSSSPSKSGRYFRGGETTILRPERANYWQSFDPTEIVERTQLFEEIEPKFNRLTIFDPRLPHGVREVKGTKDVSKGRLVLNGWFNEPAISCQGGLTIEDVGKVLDAKLDLLYEELETLPAMIGFAALRMEIEAETGHVDSISWGADTVAPALSLRDPDEVTETRDVVLATIAGMMSECVFPSSKEKSSICVPFVFG